MASRAQALAWLLAQGVPKGAYIYLSRLAGQDLGEGLRFSFDKALAGGYSEADFDKFLRRAWSDARSNLGISDKALRSAAGPPWFERAAARLQGAHFKLSEDLPDRELDRIVARACVGRAGAELGQVASVLANSASAIQYLVRERVGSKVFSQVEDLDVLEALTKSLRAQSREVTSSLGADSVFARGVREYSKVLEDFAEARRSYGEFFDPQGVPAAMAADLRQGLAPTADALPEQGILYFQAPDDYELWFEVLSRLDRGHLSWRQAQFASTLKTAMELRDADGILTARTALRQSLKEVTAEGGVGVHAMESSEVFERVRALTRLRSRLRSDVRTSPELLAEAGILDFDDEEFRAAQEVWDVMSGLFAIRDEADQARRSGAFERFLDDVDTLAGESLDMGRSRLVREFAESFEASLPPDSGFRLGRFGLDDGAARALQAWVLGPPLASDLIWRVPETFARLDQVRTALREWTARTLGEAVSESEDLFSIFGLDRLAWTAEDSVTDLVDDFLSSFGSRQAWLDADLGPDIVALRGSWPQQVIPSGVRALEDSVSMLEFWERLGVGVSTQVFDELGEAFARSLGSAWDSSRREAFEQVREAALDAVRSVRLEGRRAGSLAEAAAQVRSLFSDLFLGRPEFGKRFRGDEPELLVLVRGALAELGEDPVLAEFLTRAQRKLLVSVPVDEFLAKTYRVRASRLNPEFEGNAVEVAKLKARAARAGALGDQVPPAQVTVSLGAEDMWRRSLLSAPDSGLVGDIPVSAGPKGLREEALGGLPSVEELRRLAQSQVGVPLSSRLILQPGAGRRGFEVVSAVESKFVDGRAKKLIRELREVSREVEPVDGTWLFRGMDILPEDQQKFFAAIPGEGEVFSFGAPQSFSMSAFWPRILAGLDETKLVTHAPENVGVLIRARGRGRFALGGRAEDELIMVPGQRLRVVSKHYNEAENKLFLDVEMVGESVSEVPDRVPVSGVVSDGVFFVDPRKAAAGADYLDPIAWQRWDELREKFNEGFVFEGRGKQDFPQAVYDWFENIDEPWIRRMVDESLEAAAVRELVTQDDEFRRAAQVMLAVSEVFDSLSVWQVNRFIEWRNAMFDRVGAVSDRLSDREPAFYRAMMDGFSQGRADVAMTLRVNYGLVDVDPLRAAPVVRIPGDPADAALAARTGDLVEPAVRSAPDAKDRGATAAYNYWTEGTGTPGSGEDVDKFLAQFVLDRVEAGRVTERLANLTEEWIVAADRLRGTAVNLPSGVPTYQSFDLPVFASEADKVLWTGLRDELMEARRRLASELEAIPPSLDIRMRDASFARGFSEPVGTGVVKRLLATAHGPLGWKDVDAVRVLPSGVRVRDEDIAVWRLVEDKLRAGTLSSGEGEFVQAWLNIISKRHPTGGMLARNLWDPQELWILDNLGDVARANVLEALRHGAMKPPRGLEDVFFASQQSRPFTRLWLEPASDFLVKELKHRLADSVDDLTGRIPSFVKSAEDLSVWTQVFERLGAGVLTTGQAHAALALKAAQLVGDEVAVAAARQQVTKALAAGRPISAGEALSARVSTDPGPDVLADWLNGLRSGPGRRYRAPAPEFDGVPIWDIDLKALSRDPNRATGAVVGGGGVTGKVFLVKRADGSEWMLKANEAIAARGYGDLAEQIAHQIGTIMGLRMSPGAKLDLVGEGLEELASPLVGGSRTGFLQRLFPKGQVDPGDTLSSVVQSDADLAKFNDQLAESLVLDWFLDNPDAHTENFIISLDRKSLFGIDKGLAFNSGNPIRNFWNGTSQGGSSLFIRPSNDGWVNNLGRAYMRVLNVWSEPSFPEPDWSAAAAAVDRLASIPDNVLREMLRPLFDIKSSMNPFAQAVTQSPADFPQSTVDLVARMFAQGSIPSDADVALLHPLALEWKLDNYIRRKNEVRDRFEDFVNQVRAVRQYGRGTQQTRARDLYVPPWKVREVSTPINEALAEDLQRVGSFGRSVVFLSSDIHAGDVNFNVVKTQAGEQILRMNLSLRPGQMVEDILRFAKEESDRLAGVSGTEGGLSLILGDLLTLSRDSQFLRSSRVSASEADGRFNVLQEVFSLADIADVNYRGGDAGAEAFRKGFVAVTRNGDAISFSGFDDVHETFQGHLEILISPSGKLPLGSLPGPNSRLLTDDVAGLVDSGILDDIRLLSFERGRFSRSLGDNIPRPDDVAREPVRRFSDSGLGRFDISERAENAKDEAAAFVSERLGLEVVEVGEQQYGKVIEVVSDGERFKVLWTESDGFSVLRGGEAGRGINRSVLLARRLDGLEEVKAFLGDQAGFLARQPDSRPARLVDTNYERRDGVFRVDDTALNDFSKPEGSAGNAEGEARRWRDRFVKKFEGEDREFDYQRTDRPSAEQLEDITEAEKAMLVWGKILKDFYGDEVDIPFKDLSFVMSDQIPYGPSKWSLDAKLSEIVFPPAGGLSDQNRRIVEGVNEAARELEISGGATLTRGLAFETVEEAEEFAALFRPGDDVALGIPQAFSFKAQKGREYAEVLAADSEILGDAAEGVVITIRSGNKGRFALGAYVDDLEAIMASGQTMRVVSKGIRESNVFGRTYRTHEIVVDLVDEAATAPSAADLPSSWVRRFAEEIGPDVTKPAAADADEVAAFAVDWDIADELRGAFVSREASAGVSEEEAATRFRRAVERVKLNERWRLWRAEGRELGARLAEAVGAGTVARGKVFNSAIDFSSETFEDMWTRGSDWGGLAYRGRGPDLEIGYGYREVLDDPGAGFVSGLRADEVLEAVISHSGDDIRLVSRQHLESLSESERVSFLLSAEDKARRSRLDDKLIELQEDYFRLEKQGRLADTRAGDYLWKRLPVWLQVDLDQTAIGIPTVEEVLDFAIDRVEEALAGLRVTDIDNLSNVLLVDDLWVEEWFVPKAEFVDRLLQQQVLDSWLSPLKAADADDLVFSFSVFDRADGLAGRQFRLLHQDFRPFEGDTLTEVSDLVTSSALYERFWEAVRSGNIVFGQQQQQVLEDMVRNIQNLPLDDFQRSLLDYANLRRFAQEGVADVFGVELRDVDALRDVYVAAGLDERLVLAPGKVGDDEFLWVGPQTNAPADSSDFAIVPNKIFEVSDDFVAAQSTVKSSDLHDAWKGYVDSLFPRGGILEPPSQVGLPEVERALELIRNFGVQLDEPNLVNQDLLYWELVLGQEMVNSAGQSKAALAAQRLLNELPLSAGPDERAAAIRAGFEEAGVLAPFERVNTAPFFPHLLDGTEFGHPIYMRPGEQFLDEFGVPFLQDMAVVHDIRYLMGQENTFWWLLNPAGGGGAEQMLSQRAKVILGLFDPVDPGRGTGTVRDRIVGGGNSVYGRMVTLTPGESRGGWDQLVRSRGGHPGGILFMNPARQRLKYDFYSANVDADGATALRPSQNPVSAEGLANQQHHMNETMSRWMLTMFDDVEVGFTTSPEELDRILSWLRSEGITEIRGVPIEERWVYIDNVDEASEYVYNFAQKHFDWNPKSL